MELACLVVAEIFTTETFGIILFRKTKTDVVKKVITMRPDNQPTGSVVQLIFRTPSLEGRCFILTSLKRDFFALSGFDFEMFSFLAVTNHAGFSGMGMDDGFFQFAVFPIDIDDEATPGFEAGD